MHAEDPAKVVSCCRTTRVMPRWRAKLMTARGVATYILTDRSKLR